MKRKDVGKLLAIIGLFIVIVTVGYFVGRKLEQSGYEQPPVQAFDELDLYSHIEVDGKTYFKKSNLTTMLLIGVDRTSTQAVSTYRSGGQADFLMLLVLDHSNRQIHQLQIDRDTMTDVVMVSILGKRTGTRVQQICLSHGFGRNDAERCGYTVEAVQNLLLGEPIELYLAVNLEAIDQLNDLLGGVPVTVEDDFSEFDAGMTPGTSLVLQGAQAELFVRGRLSIGDGTNASRMRRQRMFMSAAVEKLRQCLQENPDFIGLMYDDLGDSMTTNISKGRMINELNQAYHYEVLPMETFSGEHTRGSDGFIEFHPEEKSVVDWILKVFYKQAK